MTPCRRWPGATAPARRPRSRTSTMGARRGERRLLLRGGRTSVGPRRASPPSRRTACRAAASGPAVARPRSFVASQASWKPPSPFTAMMLPRAAAQQPHRVALAPRPGALRIDQREPRSAVWAGHGLGVEPPVGRVPVFPRAGRTHGKGLHARAFAIVRKRLDDRESRAAVRAVDERVAVPAVSRVEELGETRVAGGDVRRDHASSARRPSARAPRRRTRRPGGRGGASRRSRPEPGAGARPRSRR